ncbi:MAG: lactate dehydrogenase [Shinella sp.]|nr:MAG: lactate dehydrogenase [Shinella sp.]
MSETESLTLEEAEARVTAACRHAGANLPTAASLARATLSAEASGNTSVGLSHLIDYLTALREGRISGNAAPVITSPAPALIRSDANGGIAQLGFDLAFDDLVEKAKSLGIALFAQRNSFTSGELGYYPFRLAERGLMSFAFTTGPALLTVEGASRPLYCTNPMAFAAPADSYGPLLIDQASSNTAYVNIRSAAERSETIPLGWAVDSQGHPTTNPNEAMRGALLAFGGSRGANIALMVEILASGLSAANWSMDAPSFTEGDQSPGSGLTVIAIAPALLDEGFETRLAAQLKRLAEEGVHVPGIAKAKRMKTAASAGIIVGKSLMARIDGFAAHRG